MSSRERLRAALKEPSRHPSSPSFLPSSLLVLSLSITPSPLHIAQQPFFSGGAPLFHLYTRLSSPPLRQNVCRETRVPSPPPSTGEQPLWHRREPALISHLPLFFISDIRIYHRDPAGTSLEGRGRGRGEGMETNQGPRREGEREGEDTVEKRWRGTDDYRSGGVASIADDYRPPFTPTTWMDPDPFHFVHYVFLFYLSLPPLAPKRWRKLCRCTTLIFHSSIIDGSINRSFLPPRFVWFEPDRN